MADPLKITSIGRPCGTRSAQRGAPLAGSLASLRDYAIERVRGVVPWSIGRERRSRRRFGRSPGSYRTRPGVRGHELTTPRYSFHLICSARTADGLKEFLPLLAGGGGGMTRERGYRSAQKGLPYGRFWDWTLFALCLAKGRGGSGAVAPAIARRWRRPW